MVDRGPFDSQRQPHWNVRGYAGVKKTWKGKGKEMVDRGPFDSQRQPHWNVRGYAGVKKTWKGKGKEMVDRGPFDSQMDYRSRLQFNASASKFPLSGIVCTIGPASNNTECIINLIKAGVRIIRLNFSHGTHQEHYNSIRAIREAIAHITKEVGVYKSVAIALDTKGPEIRTGKIALDNTEIKLERGDIVHLSTNKDVENNCTKDLIYVDYKGISNLLKPGNDLFLDDGLILLKVKQINADIITCNVENAGLLGSRKGVNLPGVPIDLPTVSEKDISDLKFAVEEKLDFIFASFIRNAKALTEIRQILGPNGRHIKIISKIENQQGMLNIDEIITASDGIMVARGDLGIEILTEEVVIAQKAIIAKCNKIGKPVICATQMLESMINKPRPTRAEASDVANAIFDGADCVMLSGETAKGMYPVECVKCMARICAKVETALWYGSIQNEVKNFMKTKSSDQLSTVSLAITEMALLGDAKAILIVSPCDLIPQLVSHFRASCPIIMLTGSAAQARQTLIYRGIYPFVLKEMKDGSKDFKQILQAGIKELSKLRMLEVEKIGTIVIVDALKADRISFRLLSIKREKKLN
ncbi:pyruvate kinase-like [Drosophila tropicalis]|uniref:pyruvate kinase-like n=1 Tax=Drosophila tropicalis TaxID=46794 RepID=UPI0035AB714A